MFKISSYLPTEIIFRVGAVDELEERAKKLGKKH